MRQQSVKVEDESIEGGLLEIKESVPQGIVKQEPRVSVKSELSSHEILDGRHIPTFVALEAHVGIDKNGAKKRIILR